MVALPVPTSAGTLHDRIQEEILFDPEADDARVAGRVLRSIDKDDLLPLLIEKVRVVRREFTRHVERQAIAHLVAIASEAAAPRCVHAADRVAAETRKHDLVSRARPLIDRLRSQRLDLGDGTSVRWGEATVDQLKQRYAMLRQQERGLTATMEQIKSVIAALQHAGASCLDELAV